MRKTILLVCLIGGLLLSFHTTAQQANARNHQVWKTNMDAAKLVEEAVNTLRKIHEANRVTGLPPDFHYHILDWTQQDVTTFAKCDKTFDFFETLLGLTNAALAKDKAQAFTADAIEAQNAIAYIKPASCNSWVGFAKMIANASSETEALRTQYHREIESGRRGIK